MMGDHLSRETLYAYQDGVLPEAERQTVELHLGTCSLCQNQLYRSTALIRALKERLGEERAPFALRRAVQTQIRSPQRAVRVSPLQATRFRAIGLASALLLVSVMLAIAYRPWAAQPLLQQLSEAHMRLVLKPELIQVQGDAVSLSNWFKQQPDQPITVPTVERLQLIGGRMDAIDGQPAAHILYRQGNATAMSLLVWRGHQSLTDFVPRDYEGGRFYVGQFEGSTAILWPMGEPSYACVGQGQSDELLDIASDIWQQLSH